MYRHPPPVPGRSTRSQEEDAINETVLSAASLNGGPMPHFYNPCDNMIWTQTGPYPQYMLTPSYPPRQPAFEQTHQQQGFEQHTKVRKKTSGYSWESCLLVICTFAAVANSSVGLNRDFRIVQGAGGIAGMLCNIGLLTNSRCRIFLQTILCVLFN